MSEEINSDIRTVGKTVSTAYRDNSVDPEGKRKRGERERDRRDEAGDHFDELNRAAEITNDDFEKRNVPYRFYLRQEDGELFIELVVLDDEGNITEVNERNITHQDFSEWLSHIERGDGLFVDSRG